MHNFTLDVKGTDVVKAMDKARAHLWDKVPYEELGAHMLQNGTEVAIRIQTPKESSQTMMLLLNEWFAEDTGVNPPFPTGALLYWHLWDEPGNFPEGSERTKLGG